MMVFRSPAAPDLAKLKLSQAAPDPAAPDPSKQKPSRAKLKLSQAGSQDDVSGGGVGCLGICLFFFMLR